MQHSKHHRMEWSEVDCVIEKWLKERQCLLVMYTELCLMKPFKQFKYQPGMLKSFCQILIDYVSAGHFEIFERIAEAEKNCDETKVLDKQILINILRTTLVALDFNDKYAKADNFVNLETDLSELGKKMDDRMEWEDQLIRHFLEVTNQHKPLARAPSI